MADTSWLNWPFLDDPHRALARDLTAWRDKSLDDHELLARAKSLVTATRGQDCREQQRAPDGLHKTPNSSLYAAVRAVCKPMRVALRLRGSARRVGSTMSALEEGACGVSSYANCWPSSWGRSC